MTKKYKLTYIFAAIAATIVLIFSSYIGGGAIKTYAATATSAAIEQSNVLDDLEGSVIDGVPFSLEDYNFDDTKGTQLLSFVEFCYTSFTNLQQDYGLYIYIYNPKGLNFIIGSPLNKVALRFGGKESDKYVKYDLKFLNQSTEEGTEGLFYKFKVVLSDSQRSDILKNLDSDSRIYEVSEIELLIDGDINATAVEIVTKYTFSGFVKGYGPVGNTEELSCIADNYKDYLNLEVHHTFYRPKGDFYEGKQSQLNSCYFRVPESYFTDFGELYSIACEWYEYIAKPVLVTENSTIYQHLYALHGGDVHGFADQLDFFIIGLGNTDRSPGAAGKYDVELLSYVSDRDGLNDKFYFDGSATFTNEWDLRNVDRINNFAAVFSAVGMSYKDRTVHSDEVKEQLKYNSNFLGGPLINGKYSEALFADYVDNGHTRGKNTKEISIDDLFDIFWNTTVKNTVWQKWFGGFDVETYTESLKAIEIIEEDDLKGSDKEVSLRLYVREDDVPAIREEFDKCNNEQLVLFRYGTSEYISYTIHQKVLPTSTKSVGYEMIKACWEYWKSDNVHRSGYIAQETVYLDFDIISLTFSRDNVKVVIPVVASPQDVFSDFTPPLEENYHTGGGCAGARTFSIILIALGSVGAAILIIKFIIWIWGNVNQSKKE